MHSICVTVQQRWSAHSPALALPGLTAARAVLHPAPHSSSRPWGVSPVAAVCRGKSRGLREDSAGRAGGGEGRGGGGEEEGERREEEGERQPTNVTPCDSAPEGGAAIHPEDSSSALSAPPLPP